MRRGFHAPGRFFQKFCGQRGKKCPFTGAREAGWREAQEGQSPKKGTERVSLRGRDLGPVASCGLRRSENPAAKGFCQKHGASPQGRAVCGAYATERSTKTRHRTTVSAIPTANRRGHGTGTAPAAKKAESESLRLLSAPAYGPRRPLPCGTASDGRNVTWSLSGTAGKTGSQRRLPRLRRPPSRSRRR